MRPSMERGRAEPSSSETARRRLLLALVALAAGACVASLVHDLDTPWHVATGRWILAHHALPDRDPFSFSFPGAPWQNHSPLAQVTMALAHGVAGWAGVVVWQVAVTAGIAWAGVASAVRRGARVELAAPIALLALVGETAVLGPRPNLLAALLTVVSLDLLLDVGRDPTSRRVWALPVVYGLAIPTHATHALIPVLATALLLAWMALGDRPRARRLLGPTGLCVALFAAFGRDALSLIGAHSGGFMQSSITEWVPVSIPELLGTADGWLLLLTLGAALIGALWRLAGWRAQERRVLVESALVIVGAAAALLTSYRGLSLFVVAALPLWLPSVTFVFERLLDRASVRLPIAVPIAILALVVVWRGGGRPLLRPGFGLDEERFPVAAVRAMRAAGATERVYDAYNFGGYLIFEGIPVLIDGRAVTVYPEPFLERFAAAYGSAAVFEELAQRYDVRTVLLPVGSARAAPLIDRLEHDPAWRRLHRDDVAVVFVR